MKILRITTSNPLYKKAVALRDAVLRRPLGLTLTADELEMDASREHLIALEGELVVGGVSFFLQEPTLLRVKQMAVDPTKQGRGIGKQLLRAAEQQGIAMGAVKSMLHARETAAKFYEAQGYQTVSEAFSEKGIAHFVMEKTLR